MNVKLLLICFFASLSVGLIANLSDTHAETDRFRACLEVRLRIMGAVTSSDYRSCSVFLGEDGE